MRRGRIATEWSDGQVATTDHLPEPGFLPRGDGAVRGGTTHDRSTPMAASASRCTFSRASRWHSCLLYELGDGERAFRGRPAVHSRQAEQSEVGRGSRTGSKRSSRSAPATTSSSASFGRRSRTWRRCACRSRARDHLRFVPAAGVPWFVALFGRDSLIASLQTALVYPELRARRRSTCSAAPGDRARRLPRRRAGQDHARAAPRRACALQADPAHALLRHRGRDAALPDRAA